MAELAIDHPKHGPRIRSSRILRPEERDAREAVANIRKQLMKLDALDKEMVARLEAALDDSEELERLAGTYLSDSDRLRLGYWPEGRAYLVLEEAELIARFIRERYRPDLNGFAIAVIFEKKLSPVLRRGRLGTAAKLPGKTRFLTEFAAQGEGVAFDAVITLGFLDWVCLTDADRQRLVHHELEHLAPDGEGGIMLVPHDFEDFRSIWELYGPASETGVFSSDSIGRKVTLTGSQMDLMEEAV
ncbi:MAG TPA: putative metallopeptidase [Longimicrobiaceae bacterium]